MSVQVADGHRLHFSSREVLPGAVTPFTLTALSKTLELTMQHISADISRLTFRSRDGYCLTLPLFRMMIFSHSTALLNFLEVRKKKNKPPNISHQSPFMEK
jgi:hypothetical protein